MTSAINPNNINVNYPVAGQSNNTQGFRDNFNGIQTNFTSAANEITELQNKAILKAALTGTTLDNNMNYALLSAAKIQAFSATAVTVATTSGSVTIDYSAGHYQTINTSGNISINFSNWPLTGTVGLVRLQVIINTAGTTMTLPAAVTLGLTGIQGLSGNTITFATTGTFEFAFLTRNAGTSVTIYDLNRPLSTFTNNVTITANTVSANTTTGALTVAGGVGVAGNINAARITGNIVAATGYFVGDGGYLSNVTVVSNVAVTQIANGSSKVAVTSSGGNIAINVGGIANAALFTTSGVGVLGNVVTGGYFVGDGGLLSNIEQPFIQNGTTNIQISAANANITMDVAGTNDVVTVGNTGVSIQGLVSATGNVIGDTGIFSRGSITANLAVGNLISSGNVFATGDMLTSSIYATGNILSSTATGGIGFTSGSGGTSLQSSSKSSGVTLNRPTGEITYATGALGSGANVSFTLTNSCISNTDVMIINHVSGGTIGGYTWNPVCNAGNAVITMTNRTAGSLNEQPVIRFVVIKGSTS